jgi:hypothetical protein
MGGLKDHEDRLRKIEESLQDLKEKAHKPVDFYPYFTEIGRRIKKLYERLGMPWEGPVFVSEEKQENNDKDSQTKS